MLMYEVDVSTGIFAGIFCIYVCIVCMSIAYWICLYVKSQNKNVYKNKKCETTLHGCSVRHVKGISPVWPRFVH